MRNIKYIVVHCTATPQNTTIDSILRFWKDVRKWHAPGYHYVVKPDGEIVQLLDEKLISNGAFGHNPECVHIAYIGGIDKDGKPLDNRTDRQRHSLFDKLVELSERYPQARILGHRDFPNVAKACPSFDVKSWLASYTPDLSDRNHETGLAA
jgi:N-acetylmuramoyl-L-alanine amidase